MKLQKVVVALVLFAMVLSWTMVGSGAEWLEDVVLDNCDQVRWSGMRLNTTDQQEGKACVEWTITGGSDSVLATTFPAVDATGANTLAFDLYISDLDALYTCRNFWLEMTSSGTCDVEEDSWNFLDSAITLQEGWNHLELSIEKSGGACDLSRVNYLRIACQGVAGEGTRVTMRLDNIYLTWVEPDPGKDRSQFVMGEKDASTATPPQTEEEKPGDSDKDGDQTKTDGGKTPVGAIVLLAVGAVALGAGVVLLLGKKNRGLSVVALILAVAMLVGGVAWIFVGKEDASSDDGDKQGDSGTKKPDFLSVDQTGHPEVSAADVDVEALLAVVKGYDTTEDYRIRFAGSAASTIPDYSQSPRVVFHQAVEESGILFRQVTDKKLEFLSIKGTDCWIFEHFRGNDTNRMQLSFDEKTAASYAGKDVNLNFVAYVSQQTTFSVRYVNTDGETVTAEATSTRNNQFMTASVTLHSPAFTKAVEGYDFYVTMTGSELIRVHAIYASEPEAGVSVDIGLMDTKYETSSYIVADANVRAFGAAGDGLTDDTAAFRAAISAVEKMGGGTVYVPVGYYCLTDTLSLPIGVGLVGDLKEGTAEGSVLMIYGGKGETDIAKSAVMMSHQSAVKNIAFWYPEQTFVNGSPIPYPPTLTQDGSESVTIQNVTLVNSYFGINFAKNGNNSLQYVRDVYGTCLYLGYENNISLDIGRIENLNLSPRYWLESGMPGTPNAQLLRTWLLRNATGMLLEKIDWTYLADITIEGYYKGVHTSQVENGPANGHMYNFKLLDCYYCFYSDALSWMMITHCQMRAAGNDGAACIYLEKTSTGELLLSDSYLESKGANAIINNSDSDFSVTSSYIESQEGTAWVTLGDGAETLINSVVAGKDYKETHYLVKDDTAPTLPQNVDYGKTVTTKPTSRAFINLSKAPYSATPGTDITDILQKALDDLKETGGTVYIPAGSYRLEGHVDIWAGIEVRGAVSWAQNMNRTSLLTKFGEDDPDGTPLMTLYEGAGIRGFGVIYDHQDTSDLKPYSFTVQGKGKGVYVVDISLPTSYNGVDFATYRCDEHYIEYLWMAPLNVGIEVGGGSENGIIRDCHFTPNTWCLRGKEDYWENVDRMIMAQSRPYVIGKSKNQILYHNFVFAAYQGLSILDGAQNVYSLCHGVDAGNISAYFEGDCTATLVDSQLVNRDDSGANRDMNYIRTNDDFTGSVEMIGLAAWGSPKSALYLEGDGNLAIRCALISAAGSPMARLDAGSLSVWGMFNRGHSCDYAVGADARALLIAGNVYASGLRLQLEDGAPTPTGSDMRNK